MLGAQASQYRPSSGRANGTAFRTTQTATGKLPKHSAPAERLIRGRTYQVALSAMLVPLQNVLRGGLQ